MKWIGQHIWDFVSRFRNDVYLESTEEGKPTLTIESTNTALEAAGELKFVKNAADVADREFLGTIGFYGDNSANETINYSQIRTIAFSTTDGQEAGRLYLNVAQYDGTMTTGLYVNGDTDVDDNVDVLIANGVGSTTTISGILNAKDIISTANYHTTTFENRMSADGASATAYGKILKYSPGASETLNGSEIYFLHTDGTWDQADADAVATGASQLLGVGLGGNSQSVGVLTEGYIRIASTEILNVPGSGAVDGLPLYVSTTAGHFDFTAPSGSGDFVRIVGYAIDDHGGDVLVYFNPDKTWVEIS
tara:strand:+ start:464 stop:1381 length:918 start_codon:yes stop_codon:yes gene_type:complete